MNIFLSVIIVLVFAATYILQAPKLVRRKLRAETLILSTLLEYLLLFLFNAQHENILFIFSGALLVQFLVSFGFAFYRQSKHNAKTKEIKKMRNATLYSYDNLIKKENAKSAAYFRLALNAFVFHVACFVVFLGLSCL